MNTESRRRRPLARSFARPGAPLVLIALLAAGLLGAAVLVYQVWRSQYDNVLTSLLRQRQQAAASLAVRLDAAFQSHFAQSTRYLLEGDLASAAPRIAALKRRFPDLEQVMRFDAGGGMVYCVPGPSTQPEDYRHWLAGRLKHALGDRAPGDISAGHFLEHLDGRSVLYAYAPIPPDLTDGASGWIVMRHGTAKLLDALWNPLQAEFVEQQGGAVTLKPGLPELASHDVAIPAAASLTGWTLHYSPDTERLSRIAREQSLLLGMLLLGLGALPLAAIVGWIWYGRRRLELAQAKDDFVAHVSHELRTPLALIRLHAESLALGRVPDPARQRGYLETIVRESERLTRMIEQVLDFARMRREGSRFRMDASDLRSTVEQILEGHRQRLELDGLMLRYRSGDDLPAVPHDAAGVACVLTNLLDNAARHSPPGGAIEVSLSRAGDAAALEVADRGSGIAGEDVERLMAPFERGSAAGSQRAKGVGLGLAIVARAMQAHGGSFQLLARDGGGTLARACFPSVEHAA